MQIGSITITEQGFFGFLLVLCIIGGFVDSYLKTIYGKKDDDDKNEPVEDDPTQEDQYDAACTAHADAQRIAWLKEQGAELEWDAWGDTCNVVFDRPDNPFMFESYNDWRAAVDDAKCT